MFVEPLDRDFGGRTEGVVAVEAAVGALDPVQALLRETRGVLKLYWAPLPHAVVFAPATPRPVGHTAIDLHA